MSDIIFHTELQDVMDVLMSNVTEWWVDTVWRQQLPVAWGKIYCVGGWHPSCCLDKGSWLESDGC